MQGILKPFEVRDRRSKERFVIDDIYLNGWAKKCRAYATAVYVSLCRHSNTEQYCWPSLKKIGEEHSMSIRQVSRALIILEKYGIVIRERLGKKSNNRYWLTDKSEWTISPITMDSQSNHHRTDSPIHSKDTHIKDTHSKVRGGGFAAAPKDMKPQKEENEHGDDGLPDIDADTGERIPVKALTSATPVLDLLRLFQPVNPSYYLFVRNKTEIASIRRLRDQYGEEKLTALITALPEIIKQPYAPRITSPYQLETQIGKLKAFIDQQDHKGELKEIIGL